MTQAELYTRLKEFVDYFKPNKALMNDELRAMINRAEQALEKTKP